MSLEDKIIRSLKNIDTRFTSLSKLCFDEISLDYKTKLDEQKVQERPFAYEFYHMIRKDFDNNENEGIVIQAEVNKRYQMIPNLDKIPDFLIHIPSSRNSLAVIEFKMATRLEEFKKDFYKLSLFEKYLGYEELYEVIIGNSKDIKKAKMKINDIDLKSEGIISKICVLYFNYNSIVVDIQYINRC